MAWDDDMPTVVRTLLQDVAATPVYSDDGLIQVILIQGMKLQSRFRFANSYAISFSNATISPDPTLAATRDDAFLLLTCYSAVVTLIQAEIRSMTRQGITIQDGDSRISLQRSPQALALMLKAYQDVLDELIYNFETGGDGFGEVIVTPYPIFGWAGGGGGYGGPPDPDVRWRYGP